jgi:hypothetical protein
MAANGYFNLAYKGFEVVGAHGYLIDGRLKAEYQVRAGRRRDRVTHRIGTEILDVDSGSGHSGSGLIHHRAGDLSRFKLRRSHDTAEEQYGEGDEYNQR